MSHLPVWQVEQSPTLVTYVIQDRLGKQTKTPTPTKTPFTLLGYFAARPGPRSSAAQPTRAALAQPRRKGRGGHASSATSERYAESCLRMLSTEVTPDGTGRTSDMEGPLSVLSRILLKLCVGLWKPQLVLERQELAGPVLLTARSHYMQSRARRRLWGGIQCAVPSEPGLEELEACPVLLAWWGVPDSKRLRRWVDSRQQNLSTTLITD